MPSHRSSRHFRAQSIARKSADDITDPDNSASEYTALASVHESATDSDESNISGPDSEDIEVTTGRISKTTTTWDFQRVTSKKRNVCATEIH
jgi:hypothetical protein